MTEQRMESFEEFWPFYVGEHRDPLCRALHYVGTSLAIGTVATAVLTANPSWLLLTPVVGYAPAWFGHFLIEGNVPATFKHPLWSLRGDFRMLRLALEGRMAAEVERLYPSESVGESTGPTDRARPSAPAEVHANGATAL
jgi:hypothetical protein